MLPEDQHAGAYQALNAEFALRLEEHLAAQQQASMASLSSSSSIPTIAPVALTQPPQAPLSSLVPPAPPLHTSSRKHPKHSMVLVRR